MKNKAISLLMIVLSLLMVMSWVSLAQSDDESTPTQSDDEPTPTQEVEVTQEATAEVLLSVPEIGDHLDIVVSGEDAKYEIPLEKWLEIAERIAPLVDTSDTLRDAWIISVVAIVVLSLIWAFATGRVPQTINRITDSVPAMGLFEYALSLAPDPVQASINATEPTAEAFRKWLEEVDPNSPVTTTAKALERFLEELTDGVSIRDKPLPSSPDNI